MRHRLSASGLARARRCLYWARADVDPPADAPGPEAIFGRAVDAAITATIEYAHPVDPIVYSEELTDDQKRSLAAVYQQWAEWWPTARGELKWATQVRVAWDVATGVARLLPRSGDHRDYGPLGDYEVPGTADAVGVGPGDAIEVNDWKTGFRPIESPESNPQLAHYGAAIATSLKRDRARVRYVKLSEDGVYVPGTAELDALSFDAVRAEIRDLIDRVPDAHPQPGPWCAATFCPHMGSCPATRERVDEVVRAASLVRRHPVSLEVRDNDHAADMLTAIDGVEAFVHLLRQILRQYADRNGGILLPDGTVWGAQPVHTEKPDLSVDGALHALYELGLTEAVESRTTWAAIRRAGGGAKAEKAAREALAQIGAIKASDHVRYEARTVRKSKVA